MAVRTACRALLLGAACVACAPVTACAPAPRQAQQRVLSLSDFWSTDEPPNRCGYRDREERLRSELPRCGFAPREVRAWGATPRESPPEARCPTHVRLVGQRVVAEPIPSPVEPVPWDECVPREYLTGARHVVHVSDGWLVAYEGFFGSVVFWASEDGHERNVVSNARVLGFAHAPSGGVLALASGRARLGRGAVLRFESRGYGVWAPLLVTVLPVEPTGAAFDDDGVLMGFAQGFVFRADEDGNVENVHYVARNIGRVTSIVRGPGATYFLGLECGVLRITLDAHVEEWWSARDGASGRWSACGT